MGEFYVSTRTFTKSATCPTVPAESGCLGLCRRLLIGFVRSSLLFGSLNINKALKLIDIRGRFPICGKTWCLSQLGKSTAIPAYRFVGHSNIGDLCCCRVSMHRFIRIIHEHNPATNKRNFDLPQLELEQKLKSMLG